MGERILDLSTLADRPTVRVDNQDYDIKLPEDFNLLELIQYDRLERSMSNLGFGEEASEEEIVRLMAAIDAMTALIVPTMPVEVRKRLTSKQEIAIIGAFREAAGTMRATATLPQASPSIGVS
jgi:hypothetical protein